MGTVMNHPVLRGPLAEKIGQSAAERIELLDGKKTGLEIRGELRTATLLNLSPFVLSLCSGLIPYKIPRCPESGKPRFTVHQVDTIRSYPIFLGNREMSDNTYKARWDVNILTPLMQLMEFKHFYVGETEEDEGTKQGGVVVLDGPFEGMTPESEVRTPTFMFRKNNRYIVLETHKLKDLLAAQERMMRLRCDAVLAQADTWFDDEDTRKNIQVAERTWHDFALMRTWITTPRAWRNAQVAAGDRCGRCQKQYISKTGVCSCGYVHDPFTAYMQSEIEVEHVRMKTLSKEQWAKVNAEEKRRTEARGA